VSRDNVAFIGIGTKYATYKTHVSIDADSEGDAVTLTADETVGLGSTGDPLVGQLFKYEDDGYASVQYQGYAVFDGVSGSLPSEKDAVVVNGSGHVIAMTSAQLLTVHHKLPTVHSVDSSTYKVTVLLS
jgi:hypothetical protein